MTVKEYLTATLSKFQLSPSEIDLIMINQELENVEMGMGDVLTAKTAIYNEFSALIPVMDISEGSMSIKWNMAGLRAWYSLLAKELGKEDVLASLNAPDNNVNNASFFW